MSVRIVIWIFTIIWSISSLFATSWAQTYPTKPVRVVVGFSAGSGADTVARIFAPGLSAAFGQQVIVENRSGAAGNIGAEVVARAAPDGYTLFQASMTHAVNANLYKNLAYDLVRDFAAITELVTAPYVVVVHPSLPAKSISQLVKLAQSRPGVINYASAGAGSATFLAAEQFKNVAGVNLMHVPYRGGNEAMTSVISGETSVYFPSVGAALPHITQTRLRALAVTTKKRVAQIPELPTVAESGYPTYEASNWYGLVAPAKTPRPILSAIHAAAVSAISNPDVVKLMNELGYVAVLSQPEEFAAHIKSEVPRLGKFIREAGITAQ